MTSASRSVALPDVPAVANSFPVTDDGSTGMGSTGRDTPTEVVEQIDEAMRRPRRPRLSARLIELGIEPIRLTAEEFLQTHRGRDRHLDASVKVAEIKAE